MRLTHHTYGKAKVRVLKVSRVNGQHQPKELEVAVLLQGDFEASYTQADNRLVVPTDTMKNTVYALAKERLGAENEEFALGLSEHFLKTYPQVQQVRISLAERLWERLSLQGQPHPHSFQQNQAARPRVEVLGSRGSCSLESGIEELLILKSSGSGFEGFLKDKYTTLAETKERIFATRLQAMWSYEARPASYWQANGRILEAMLEVFASRYSPSVQASLFEMGQAALQAVAEISKISLAMPNKHYLLAPLGAFGLANANEVFIPTDEPHGQIEGTVSRQ